MAEDENDAKERQVTFDEAKKKLEAKENKVDETKDTDSTTKKDGVVEKKVEDTEDGEKVTPDAPR